MKAEVDLAMVNDFAYNDQHKKVSDETGGEKPITTFVASSDVDLVRIKENQSRSLAPSIKLENNNDSVVLVDLTVESDTTDDLNYGIVEIPRKFTSDDAPIIEGRRESKHSVPPFPIKVEQDEVTCIDLTLESETNTVERSRSTDIGSNLAYDEHQVSNLQNSFNFIQEDDQPVGSECQQPKFTLIRQSGSNNNKHRLIVDCEYCAKRKIHSFDYPKHVNKWHKEIFKDKRVKCSICKCSVHYVLQYYHAAAYHDGQQMFKDGVKRSYRIFFLPVQEGSVSKPKNKSMKMKCLLCTNKTTVIRAQGCRRHFNKFHVAKEAT